MGSNIASYIDVRVFLSIKCLNLDKIAFALFNLIAYQESVVSSKGIHFFTKRFHLVSRVKCFLIKFQF